MSERPYLQQWGLWLVTVLTLAAVAKGVAIMIDDLDVHFATCLGGYALLRTFKWRPQP